MSENSDFFVCFSVISDPRVDRSKKHLLIDILFIGVCSVICGGEGFEAMEDFGKARESWFRKFLELPHGIPSHDTFRRVLSILDPVEFSACLNRWSVALHEATDGAVIALDGKTIRHSFDSFSGQSAVHLVSAWASESGLALGQVRVDDKSNEITALPALLKMIDVRGRVVTMDAMGCQKELAKEITDRGGDYLMCLKGNQGSLHDDVKFFFEEAAEADYEDVEYSYHGTTEKDHGRIETRKCWVVEEDAIDWLECRDEWAGIKSIGAVEATRKIGGKVSSETRYFISSLTGTAERFARSVREHWAIENSLHYVLDVTMNEDKSRIRKDNAPENFAILRKIAISAINGEKTHKLSVKRKMRKAAWDDTYLEKVLLS